MISLNWWQSREQTSSWWDLGWGCSEVRACLWPFRPWGGNVRRTDQPVSIDMHACQLNYFPLNQWQVLPPPTGMSKSARMHSTMHTHNWVLNTMVRSWNATLAARPKPSPRTMAKMKVMIQISCKKRATHAQQFTLTQLQCLRSRALRKHELLEPKQRLEVYRTRDLPREVISFFFN